MVVGKRKDFLLALQHGRKPGGSFYYPAFPYRAYAGLRDEDVLDIGSYLMSLEPAKQCGPRSRNASLAKPLGNGRMESIGRHERS